MDLSGAIREADSFYAILAIAIIGFYSLGWKWGGELLKLSREGNKQVTEAKDIAEKVHDEVESITASIATDHDTDELGEAINKISAWIVESQKKDSMIHSRFVETDERIDRIERMFETVLERLGGARGPAD